jgi:hypothetical protein
MHGIATCCNHPPIYTMARICTSLRRVLHQIDRPQRPLQCHKEDPAKSIRSDTQKTVVGNCPWFSISLSLFLSLSLIFKFPRNNYLKSKMTLSAAFSAIHLHSPSKLGPRSIPHRLFELLNRRLQQLTKVRQCTLAAVNAPEKSLASRRYPVVTW